LLGYILVTPNGKEQIVYGNKKTAEYDSISNFAFNDNGELIYMRATDRSQLNFAHILMFGQQFSGVIFAENYDLPTRSFAFKETKDNQKQQRICINGVFGEWYASVGFPGYNPWNHYWEYSITVKKGEAYIMHDFQRMERYDYINPFPQQGNDAFFYSVSLKKSGSDSIFEHYIVSNKTKIKVFESTVMYGLRAFYPTSPRYDSFIVETGGKNQKLLFPNGKTFRFQGSSESIYQNPEGYNHLFVSSNGTKTDKQIRVYHNGKKVKGTFAKLYDVIYNEQEKAFYAIVGKNYIDGIERNENHSEYTLFYGLKKKMLVYKLKIK